MRRFLPLAALAFALSACGGAKKTQIQAASGPNYEAVKARAAKAHGEPELRSG